MLGTRTYPFTGERLTMKPQMPRRNFLGLAVVGAAGSKFRLAPSATWTPPMEGKSFPRQDAGMVEEMVRVSHSDLARVKQLVEAHPALARAAMDWGFGDWEDALGAASHTGRVEIAELLIAHGARPTIFSAAMLGQLDVVKAFVALAPGCQRVLGPHSITLLSHAKAGGERAQATRAWLEQLGDADVTPKSVPLDSALRVTYTGTYGFGSAADERLDVTAEGAAGLAITRPGLPFPRGLRHLGNHEFFPAGAEAVRVRFNVVDGRATSVTVLDPGVLVTATRTG
jgi:hypothetical protein